MINFIKYDPSTGEIISTGRCSSSDLSLQGTYVVEGVGSNSDSYILSGVVVPYSETQRAMKLNKPSPTSTWSNSTMSWAETLSLAQCKAIKKDIIDVARQVANTSSFTYSGKQFSMDTHNVGDMRDINGLISNIGSLPSSFSKTWTAIDGSTLSIPDVTTWRSFFGAMVLQKLSNLATANSLKTSVDNASSQSALDAITISF